MSLNIAIIGAGPAGSALARLLQQSNQPITVTIFEAEASLNFRSQGGSLDLHKKTGQTCLKAAGLLEEFEKHARYDGEAMNICDKKFLSYIKQGGSKKDSIASTGRPEIDRPVLRELLYNSLKPDTVRWNHKLTHVDADRTLHFADGKTESGFDLIVGADGAWSKVRPLLSSEKPYYSGVAGHSMSAPDVEKNHPELYARINRGSVFSFSDGKAIMGGYMGDGSINIGTWSVREEGWQGGFEGMDLEKVKEVYQEFYHDWDPRLVDFVRAGQDPVARDLYMMPVGHKWENVPGVTIIGDAAHLMTPFAGEGVNLALQDSLYLSQAILSSLPQNTPQTTTQTTTLTALHSNIAAFEQSMFARATETQQLTVDMMNSMFFTPGAPRNGIEKYIVRAVEGELGWWTSHLLVKPLVYAYFAGFKVLH